MKCNYLEKWKNELNKMSYKNQNLCQRIASFAIPLLTTTILKESIAYIKKLLIAKNAKVISPIETIY
jgi:hypothetical protein